MIEWQMLKGLNTIRSKAHRTQEIFFKKLFHVSLMSVFGRP